MAGAPVPIGDERWTDRAGEPDELDPGLAGGRSPAGDADAFRVLYRAAAQGHEEHGPGTFPWNL